MLQDWYVIREDEMSRRQTVVSQSQMRGREVLQVRNQEVPVAVAVFGRVRVTCGKFKRCDADVSREDEQP